MNKLSVILSFMIFLISYAPHSWALPPCPTSGYKHNCIGTIDAGKIGKYEGEIKNNKANGNGTFIFGLDSKWAGDRYEGQYIDNKIHGEGIYNFASGSKYIGEFRQNKRHGQGTYIFVSGNKYVGEFKNGKYNGQGTFTFNSGEKYVGEFKNGKENGQGTYTYKSGNKYVGEFKNGKYNGQGTFIFKSGAKDVGEFQNGKLNGFAIRYDKYGTILKQGIWKDDKFLYSQNKSTSSNSNSKLDKYKSFCEEIGFVQGTEKFGDCVLEAMKKG